MRLAHTQQFLCREENIFCPSTNLFNIGRVTHKKYYYAMTLTYEKILPPMLIETLVCKILILSDQLLVLTKTLRL